MKHYLIFRKSTLDRVAIKDSGYPWAAFLFSPLWAIRRGLILHGVVLAVLYGSCVALMGGVTNGLVGGAAMVLWLGVFTAHNANEWLASLYERRGYKLIGAIEADSAGGAVRAHREPKRSTGLLEDASSEPLSEMLTVTPSRTGT